MYIFFRYSEWKSIDSTSPHPQPAPASQRLFPYQVLWPGLSWSGAFPWKLPQGPMPQYFPAVASLNSIHLTVAWRSFEASVSLCRLDLILLTFCKLTLALKHSPLFNLTSIYKPTFALLVFLCKKEATYYLPTFHSSFHSSSTACTFDSTH
jgi:hypothetical protein